MLPDDTVCSVRVVLPLPPTTNNLFVNVRGRGRVPSKVYAAWRKLVAPILATVPPVYELPVVVSIEILGGKGFAVNCDIDNRVKAVLDALVASEIIPNDSRECVRRVVVEYHDEAKVKPKDRQPARVRVTVRTLDSG